MIPRAFNASLRPPSGRRDSSGIRLHYTPTLRPYDAGIMELGLVYTPIMAVPPRQHAFDLSGYCSSRCTQTVRITPPTPPTPRSRRPGLNAACVDPLGPAPQGDLHLRVPAPHPPGGPSGEDGAGEGGRGAGGGAGRPALQRTLPGKGLPRSPWGGGGVHS